MAIYTPGKRDRRGRLAAGGRTAVVTLSLTAMVDMFTVLVVFLLMNYQTTGEVLPMKENVDLPTASSVKELKPSNVVVVSLEGAELNGEPVATFEEIKASQNWVLETLKTELEKSLEEQSKERRESLANQVKDAVRKAKDPNAEEDQFFHKVTIQADKKVDILSLKKIMYTITQAGGEAINFAVIKTDSAKAE